MRMYGHKRNGDSGGRLRSNWLVLPPLFVLLFGVSTHTLAGQTASQGDLSQQIQKLTDSMARTQAQVEQSQRELDEMRKELAALQRQMAQVGSSAAAAPSPVPPANPAPQPTTASNAAAIGDIRETQTVHESQIATLAQSKVESESKYPVKITGLLLLNGFVNTGAVDMPATPTVALPDPGSTGATLRQSVLGLDARGPHVFGARTYGDVRVDFDGISQPAESAGNVVNYTGYYSANSTFLRLRTARGLLQWQNTQAYFLLDRPIFSTDTPTSLTAVAIPALGWSGNLWTWNPQVGVTRDFGIAGSRDVQLQAALIDVADAPVTPMISTSGTLPPSTAELSRWPGVEAHASILGAKLPGATLDDDRAHFGVGGYFAPHSTTFGRSFDSWAGTLDMRLPLPARLQLTGAFYRGLALGGLGGGAYKDFVYRIDPDSGTYYLRPLDDVGGWAQLKEKFSERLQVNAAYGIDNAFANELRLYAVPGGTVYQNLARNRTFTGNVIYSPSAWILFSLEYRHLESSPIIGLPADSNIVGMGAGYKF